MSVNNSIVLLREQLAKTLYILNEINGFYHTLKSDDIPKLGKCQASAAL